MRALVFARRAICLGGQGYSPPSAHVVLLAYYG
jgi:hypothetical protein